MIILELKKYILRPLIASKPIISYDYHNNFDTKFRVCFWFEQFALFFKNWTVNCSSQSSPISFHNERKSLQRKSRNMRRMRYAQNVACAECGMRRIHSAHAAFCACRFLRMPSVPIILYNVERVFKVRLVRRRTLNTWLPNTDLIVILRARSNRSSRELVDLSTGGGPPQERRYT